MKIASAARIVMVPVLALAFIASGAFARQSETKAGMPPGSSQTGQMSGNMRMMAMHNQMMGDMKALDASLDMKVAAMNAAGQGGCDGGCH